MARAFLFVLDSFGIGGAPDAASFGDAGANTLGHIAAACSAGAADRTGLREGPLHLPNMTLLGLAQAAIAATGTAPAGLDASLEPQGFFAAAEEVSRGKDTPSGHWEIAGVPAKEEWGYFPRTIPTFPPALTASILEKSGLPGILGDCHASGTDIIARLGEEHIRSGKPICYTSSDSVYQIAAHEDHFGLEKLYALCETVFELVGPLNIGRVIARPFIGSNSDNFTRTGNRRDFAVPPPEPTLLDRLTERGSRIIAVGKIGDIFAHQGISEVRKASGNMALFDATLGAIADAGDGDLVFTNFVDFDSLYGHRRDIAGYAAALEAFDARLPEITSRLKDGDLLILTADHGCDPSWHGTDHTRERVPVIGTGPGMDTGSLGVFETFSDIAETIAEHLGLRAGKYGTSHYAKIAGNA